MKMSFDHLNNFSGYVMFFFLILQVSHSLLNRVQNLDLSFNKEMGMEPQVSPEFDLTLDNTSVMHSIQTLNFFQMKGKKL